MLWDLLQRCQVRQFLNLFERALVYELIILEIAPLDGAMTGIVNVVLAGDLRDVLIREEDIQDIFEGFFMIVDGACLGGLLVITTDVFELCWWLIDGRLNHGGMGQWLVKAAPMDALCGQARPKSSAALTHDLGGSKPL